MDSRDDARVSPETGSVRYRGGETRAEWTKNDGAAPSPEAVTYKYASLGRYDGSGGKYYFDGAMRDVRLYARALSKAEIQDVAGSWYPPPDP